MHESSSHESTLTVSDISLSKNYIPISTFLHPSIYVHSATGDVIYLFYLVVHVLHHSFLHKVKLVVNVKLNLKVAWCTFNQNIHNPSLA